MSQVAPSPPRVLVVDDDRVILRWVQAVLAKDYKVLTALSPSEALRILDEARPDVLLTDLSMEEMTGIELLEIVRAKHPDVATLVLTGTAGKEEAIAVFQHGAYDILEKPCDPAVVRKAVDRAWQSVRSERRNRELMEELRQANDDLHEQKAQLASVVEAASNGIVAFDKNGTILSFNRAAQEMFQCSAEFAIGSNLAWFVRIADGTWDDTIVSIGRPASGGERTSHNFEGVGRNLEGAEFPVEVSIGESNDSSRRHCSAIIRDVTAKRAAEAEYRRLFAAVEQARDTVIITGLDGTIQYVNPAFSETTGYTKEEVVGANPRLLKSGRQDEAFYRNLWKTISRGDVWTGSFFNKKKDGEIIEEEARISPIRDSRGRITNYVCVKNEVTQHRALENQLRQSQKLEAIGQLAAGIAHEINTPIQFIGDNIRFLGETLTELLAVVEKAESLVTAVGREAPTPELVAGLREAIDEVDTEYMSEEVPAAIRQSLEGVTHVTRIVRAMKEFSHPGGAEMEMSDLNRAIESTVTVSRNEWKYVADLETDLDPDLGPVSCLPGELNQVFLNMIVNAAHAIAETKAKDDSSHGKIRISTRQIGDEAEIRITDTGAGMPEGVKAKIFDPFFTTKEVGKGTGQGLSIAHNVITKKHGGTITVESEPGKGTIFTITLPMAARLPEPKEVLV
ncbi:MAG: PAS domain S-box protein [Planctomycetota bacterium]